MGLFGSSRTAPRSEAKAIVYLGRDNGLPWNAAPDVRVGSKSEILAASRCFPLYPQDRTSRNAVFMSVSCQRQTFAGDPLALLTRRLASPRRRREVIGSPDSSSECVQAAFERAREYMETA